jgi:hypothetical protein
MGSAAHPVIGHHQTLSKQPGLSNAKSGMDREAAPGFRCTQSGCACYVIPGRHNVANPESITTNIAGQSAARALSRAAGVMDSGLLAALGPGMTHEA